jgi:hypothetical protein
MFVGKKHCLYSRLLVNNEKLSRIFRVIISRALSITIKIVKLALSSLENA